MVLDAGSEVLDPLVQGHPLSAKDQLVEVLAMVRPDDEPGVDVRIDEDIVEDGKIRDRAAPCPVVEDDGRRRARPFEDDVRRVRRV